LNHRRGGYRVWRTPEEKFVKSCIRERWKGYTEFQFWGCFSYDSKGPCHIWHPETAQERKAAEKDLEELNAKLEPILREQWELETGMRRLKLRNQGGRAPQWRGDAKHGKLIRREGSTVDWYRYQKEILMKKLIPYAKSMVQMLLFRKTSHRLMPTTHKLQSSQRLKYQDLFSAPTRLILI
jgi:hypothetical protein